jgi:hypothetical protein
MPINQLWTQCRSRAQVIQHPFDREFIWIDSNYFETLKSEFVLSKNWFHPGVNYRSKHPLRHIHAIEQGSIIHLHLDTGNVSSSLLFVPVHLVCDVFPYVLIAFKTRTSLWKLFVAKNKNTNL